MRSIRNNRTAQSGVTLAETLIVLVVLTMIAAVLTSARPRSSAAMEVQKATTALAAKVAQARLTAIRTGKPMILSAAPYPCDGREVDVSLFPDGTASGSPLCIGEVILLLDPLTARLTNSEHAQ